MSWSRSERVCAARVSPRASRSRVSPDSCFGSRSPPKLILGVLQLIPLTLTHRSHARLSLSRRDELTAPMRGLSLSRRDELTAPMRGLSLSRRDELEPLRASLRSESEPKGESHSYFGSRSPPKLILGVLQLIPLTLTHPSHSGISLAP